MLIQGAGIWHPSLQRAARSSPVNAHTSIAAARLKRLSTSSTLSPTFDKISRAPGS